MRECETMIVKRGDIYYADLRPVIGSEQGGVRPLVMGEPTKSYDMYLEN